MASAVTPEKLGSASASIGFEARLWLAADKFRNNVDAVQYSQVVFVLSFLKYLSDISIEGRESIATTRRLAVMNLALRGIEADLGEEPADTFSNVQHPDLRADAAPRLSPKPVPRSHSAGLLRSERQLLANPPFNDSDCFRKHDDVRRQFGVPPKGNANFLWVQHFIHHLAPQGMAGFVLANGSMPSNQTGEGVPALRDRAFIEADLVDCMVALPGQLFYSTLIPVCLWFLAKSKAADAKRRFRDRRKQTLFRGRSTTPRRAA